MATLGAAEPPVREDTGIPRGEATEATRGTRAEAPTEPADPDPRRTADRALTCERQEVSDPFSGGCRILG